MRGKNLNLIAFFTTLFVLIALSTTVIAENERAEGILDAELVEKTAIVRSINKADRTVVLEAPDGQIVAVDVDERVRNFDQIEIGDRVIAKYYESVVLFISKSEGKPDPSIKSVMKIAPKGDKPGVKMVDTVTIAAKVEDIDHDKRLLTLTGPEGQSLNLKVTESAKEYGLIKVGDEVIVIMTDAVAISVEKP